MTTDIAKYEFKPGLPQEFEVLDIAALYRAYRDDLTRLHRTGFYHIIWFQKGSPTHLVDFNPIKIKPNTLLFLNKDTVQRFDKNNKFDGKVILFTDAFFVKRMRIGIFCERVFCLMICFRWHILRCPMSRQCLRLCCSK